MFELKAKIDTKQEVTKTFETPYYAAGASGTSFFRFTEDGVVTCISCSPESGLYFLLQKEFHKLAEYSKKNFLEAEPCDKEDFEKARIQLRDGVLDIATGYKPEVKTDMQDLAKSLLGM